MTAQKMKVTEVLAITQYGTKKYHTLSEQ